MAGGRPGVYPSLTEPNEQMLSCGLYPPHGFNVDLLPFRASLAKQDESKRARGRQVEINNGRAAMLGIFSLLSEQKVPGAVPFLSGKIPRSRTWRSWALRRHGRRLRHLRGG